MNEGMNNKKRTVYLIVSILLAIVIWFYMMIIVNPIVRTTISNVPVAFVNEELLANDQVMLMEPTSAMINVEVSGRQSDVYGLKAEDLLASVDLKGYGSGEYQIPVDVAKGSTFVIQDYSPKTIYFVLDSVVEKQVPVTVDFQGDLVAQFRALKPVIEPEMVTIAGPSKTVATVSHAVARVDVEGKQKDFQSVVTYSVVDEAGVEVLGVSRAPSTVRVSAAVELTKEVQIEAILAGSLLEGYALSGVQLIPDTILIQGDADKIRLMERVETMPVDIDLLSQTTEREVLLSLPKGIHTANGDRVVARIEIEPLEETVIEVPSERVEFYQVEEGMRAFTNPHTIAVTVQASQSVIQNLNQRDLRLYVNLQGFVPGVYKVPIEGVLLVDGEMITLLPNEMEVVVIDEALEAETEVENQE
jgi:YbbR domain-containing protein